MILLTNVIIQQNFKNVYYLLSMFSYLDFVLVGYLVVEKESKVIDEIIIFNSDFKKNLVGVKVASLYDKLYIIVHKMVLGVADNKNLLIVLFIDEEKLKINY